MHVVWNLLARQVESKANFLWWGLLAHTVLLAPYAIWQLIIHTSWHAELLIALPFSAISNAIYFISLRKAYHYAPVAIVYPLARSSPILIAIWMLLFFEVGLTWVEWLAITLSVSGLWLLAISSRKSIAKQAIPWAILAAFSTSIYSISDKIAVNHLDGFAEQMGFISIGYSLSFFALSWLNKKETGNWCPTIRPRIDFILIGGLFIGTAYALVVRAMHNLPAAHVVAFTNTGIVLAVLLSIFVFHEKESWRKRLSGSLVVVAGLLLLMLAH
jgi:phosphonate utilization associated putative membrane protein